VFAGRHSMAGDLISCTTLCFIFAFILYKYVFIFFKLYVYVFFVFGKKSISCKSFS
jgi:hypothetical protein